MADLHPNLRDLHLDTLSPTYSAIRTQVPAAFPDEEELPQGKETWVLLEHLKEGRRYEVRVCWAAIQPTIFSLATYPIQELFDTPALISSLAAYAESRLQQRLAKQEESAKEEELNPKFAPTADPEHAGGAQNSSRLFLRIAAAAEYYTTTETLMRNVPPVDVDIILDEYILNLLPRSLMPTAAYLLLVALGSYYLSDVIWNWFRRTAAQSRDAQPRRGEDDNDFMNKKST
ncbi:MAG: hypothetical protein M1816_002542 [Peltula sp. TS41687]|nr:MAG: hypothetical protein M1816_002542 [Peltula sp. TS41687]